MTLSRSRRITVLAGLAVFAVVLPLVLNWRAVYYAIYPKERLYGRWLPIDRTEGDSGSTQGSSRWQIRAVSFQRDGEVHVKYRFRSESRGRFPQQESLGPPTTPDSRWYSLNRTVSDDSPGDSPRSRVKFPDFSIHFRTFYHVAELLNAIETNRTVWVAFRFDDDGRLVLEHDEPFLPYDGKKLVLERALEGE